VILAASPAFADDEAEDEGRSTEKGTFGAGIIIGEPTGVSARLYVKDDQALQAAAGFAFIGGGIHMHLDYVFHPIILQSRDSFVLLAYVGPGVRLIQYRADNDFVAIGLRGVAGLLFDFKDNPLDAFVEVAGVIEYGFADDEGFGPALNVAAGVRYYF
jgi:hypothetical protein